MWTILNNGPNKRFGQHPGNLLEAEWMNIDGA